MTSLRSLRCLVPKGRRGATRLSSWNDRRGCLIQSTRVVSTRLHQREQEEPDLDKPFFPQPYSMNSSSHRFAPPQSKLQRFVSEIPKTLELRQRTLVEDSNSFKAKEDPVLALFREMRFTPSDWEPYAHFDPTGLYTRNLIYTDNKIFTLLLLCWNPGAESKIHDHPCDGCWLQVLQGEVQECRYEPPGEGRCGGLRCIADERFTKGEVAFINDHIGLHKIGNPSPSIPAVALHLYAPPFQRCRVWDDISSGSSSIAICTTHFSEYGWVVGSQLP